ncbi:hypothetical protein EN41_21315 [Agrobacterium tumefaciens]|nr:hypothetical protein EN41_21315 [Agrobacterium tumefaciens]
MGEAFPLEHTTIYDADIAGRTGCGLRMRCAFRRVLGEMVTDHDEDAPCIVFGFFEFPKNVYFVPS